MSRAEADDHLDPEAATPPATPPVEHRFGDLDDDGRVDLAERIEVLRNAALAAELLTGEREETVEQARRHIVIRLGTIVIGFVVLLGGLAMMVLPGPGIVGILAGLGILSRELAWAERMIEYVKKRAKVEELQQQPKWVQVAMWTFTIAAVSSSLVYFTVIR